MKHVTVNRAEIIHFAGFQRLSPALDPSPSPAFSAAPGDGLARCGWARFFEEMRAHDLALEYDPEDATSARFVPRPPGAGEHGSSGGLGHALEHARRFWGALTGRATSSAA